MLVSRRDRPLDALVELGILRLHHPVQVGLALQEPVLGVPLHQRQLVGKGAHALAFRIGQGPQPGHVEVRVAEGVERGRRRAIHALQQGPEPLPAGAHGLEHVLAGQLEVHEGCEVAQAGVDLLHA